MTAVDIDLNLVSVPLRWHEVFGRDVPTEVEIGSGKGRFLLELAAQHSERNFLAVERAGKYHALCCQRTVKRRLGNVRLLRTTAADLLFRLLGEGSVASLYVLFPDPWPKKRHHKRRLITPEVMAAVARILEPDGRLLIKTDHADYAAVIRSVLTNVPGLEPIDASLAFADLPLSGFEHKYKVEGRPIHSFAMHRSVGAVS